MEKVDAAHIAVLPLRGPCERLPRAVDGLSERITTRRQGDPMSPYLFILVADLLQVLIRKTGLIRHPVLEDSSCPVLQYADDTLLIIRGELADAQNLRMILDQFANATGRK
jgi:hypothetical protein